MLRNSLEKNIVSASLLIGFFNLLSLIFGLIRDRIIASKIGPGEMLDIYYSAFKLPDFAYIIVTSLVSSIIIIPFFIKYIKENNFIKLKQIFSTIIIFSGVTLALILFLIYILADNLINYYVPGFSQESKDLTSSLMKILLIQPFILVISSIFASLSQAKEKFLYFSLAPVLYNLGGIIGASVLYNYYGIYGLCYGIILGAISHFIINFLGFLKLKLFNLSFNYFSFEEIKIILKQGIPRAFALITQNFRLLLFVTLGSILPAGAISIYNLSFNLYWIPFNILVLSYLIASYPKFSFLESEKDFNLLINKSLQYLFFILMPIIVFGIILRAHIVRLVYGTGVFNWEDTKLIAAAFALFLLAIIFDATRRLFSRILFAKGIVWYQFFIELLLLLIQVITFFVLYKKLNYFADLFAFLLKIQGSNVLVLTLIFLFIFLAILECLILLFILKKHFKFDLNFKFIDSLISSLLAGFLVYVSLRIFENFSRLESAFLGIFLQAFISGLVGVMIWYFVMKLFRNEDLIYLEKALLNKFWKKKISAPREVDILSDNK